MKKIGIITISKTSNYGAELQAFALQKKLQMFGYDAELIDYLYFKHRKHKPTKESRSEIDFGLKRNVKNFVTYRIISPLVDNVGSIFYRPIRKRLANFKKFHEKAETKYSSTYRSYPELKMENWQYDVFIVGSDQVLNPGTATSLSPYFLEFAPADKLKMSYASSFGVSSIPSKYHELYKKYLSNLDKIAVREKQGVKLVQEISGEKAIQVLDPTLLISKEEWGKIAGRSNEFPNGQYILLYKLHESEILINYALQLKQQLNCKVYRVCKRAFSNTSYKGVINLLDAGPLEYISLFKNATFVLTTSFHGTAFSVNFNIPFYAVLRPEKANNSRITDFLENMGLSERIIWEDKKEKLNYNVDFSYANKKLEEEKNASIEYLNKAI